jgi:hypothetical protein
MKWSNGMWTDKRVAVSRLGASRRKIRKSTFGPDRSDYQCGESGLGCDIIHEGVTPLL